MGPADTNRLAPRQDTGRGTEYRTVSGVSRRERVLLLEPSASDITYVSTRPTDICACADHRQLGLEPINSTSAIPSSLEQRAIQATTPRQEAQPLSQILAEACGLLVSRFRGYLNAAVPRAQVAVVGACLEHRGERKLHAAVRPSPRIESVVAGDRGICAEVREVHGERAS
ncbi:hypothetical protein MTO96_030710 [Rhipicephalus appendiculatus]